MSKIVTFESLKKIVLSSKSSNIFYILLFFFFTFLNYINLPVHSSKVIYVPKGSINNLVKYLELTSLDKYLLYFIGKPQSGWINIKEETTTKADYLYKLCTAKAALKDITLIPGETTYMFLKLLAQELQLSHKKLLKIYKEKTDSPEGLFVPDTYKVPLGIDEEHLLNLLLKKSNEKIRTVSNKIFGNYNEKKWLHYVTVSSIIEKESANIDEMPLVSSVIYNRLEKGMKLQMDGSLNYGKYSHIPISSKRIRSDRSEYNTYKHKGLPPYPVCNVSFDAIRAAIFPARTEFLYFMKSKKGTHKFTRYYSTHIKNIKNATK